MSKIDFIVLWVDGNDPEWQKERAKYITDKKQGHVARFRDWDLMRYWFRGVEKFAPWVNCVHFVTCGHHPEWLNLNHPKLHFVKHGDFIEKKYLPLFNSCAIEMNINHIPDLEEHFVYFNDDFFITGHVRPEQFFQKGLPCDMAILDPIKPMKYYHQVLNDTIELNKHFNFRDSLKKHLSKYINLKYGVHLYKNLLQIPYPYFVGFKVHHLPTPYLKSTWDTVWNHCPDAITQTLSSRFRSPNDNTQLLFHYWQLASGMFNPINVTKTSGYYGISPETLDIICKIIKSKRNNIMVINDTWPNTDIEVAKNQLINSFDYILPQKSSFEL